MKAKKRPIYGDLKVLHPDGSLMFKTNAEKITWYLERDLISEVGPETYQLKFQPKGHGHKDQDFLLQVRLNKCVVCGIETNLNRHHVVPRTYKIWFSEEDTGIGFYDVMPLCIPDHYKYNDYQKDFMQELAERYQAPVDGVQVNLEEVKKFHRATRMAISLVDYGDRIPESRKQEIQKRFLDLMGHSNYQSVLTQEPVILQHITHGQLVMEKVEDIDAFATEWRKHFVETMQPKFLPAGWTVDRRVYEL